MRYNGQHALGRYGCPAAEDRILGRDRTGNSRDRGPAGGIAALVTIVVATMAASVSPTEAAGCKRTCQWKCDGIGAFGRCVGRWYKVCGEWMCHRKTG